jgi:hypothetical protein
MTVLPGDLSKENFHDTSALFGSSLEGVMKYQQKSDPHLQLDVPRIVTVLIQAVEDKGGFNAEGIFRISASLTDLQDLKKQVHTIRSIDLSDWLIWLHASCLMMT